MLGLGVFIVYTDLYQTFGENIDLTLLNHFLLFRILQFNMRNVRFMCFYCIY